MNMKLTRRVPVRKQPPDQRIRNFSEVCLGYTQDEAIAEARRCLQCRNKPCVAGCPVGIDIPGFIKAIADEKCADALQVLLRRNSLPAVCGRVCPQETQCEQVCTLARKGEPVAIGKLERFAADFGASKTAPGVRPPADGPKVAVIGSGPAGLTCAADLARAGAQVTVFEALHLPGGVLTYGIPEFRLPKEIVTREVAYVTSLGVTLLTDTIVGRTVGREDLGKMGFLAVFIASGAGLPSFLGIPGENLLRVYSANEFLTRVNLMKGYLFPVYDTPVSVGKTVAVIGGGNVAMDAARSALRLGAETVRVLYRRTEVEMPARREEYENAVEEGVNFSFLVAPVALVGDSGGFVSGVRVIHTRLGEPDARGRRRPVPIPGSEETIVCDTVIIAVGQNPHPLARNIFPELALTEHGTIVADPATGETNVPGVFAGGDIATGAATVISAMGAGKRAAQAILSSVASGRVLTHARRG